MAHTHCQVRVCGNLTEGMPTFSYKAPPCAAEWKDTLPNVSNLYGFDKPLLIQGDNGSTESHDKAGSIIEVDLKEAGRDEFHLHSPHLGWLHMGEAGN